MTRARSILSIYTNAATQEPYGQRINTVLHDCLDMLVTVPGVDAAISEVDDMANLLEIIGFGESNLVGGTMEATQDLPGTTLCRGWR